GLRLDRFQRRLRLERPGPIGGRRLGSRARHRRGPVGARRHRPGHGRKRGRADGQRHLAAAGWPAAHAAVRSSSTSASRPLGSRTVKAAPWLGLLATWTWPPWAVTMAETMARPRPLPPVWRERE